MGDGNWTVTADIRKERPGWVVWDGVPSYQPRGPKLAFSSRAHGGDGARNATTTVARVSPTELNAWSSTVLWGQTDAPVLPFGGYRPLPSTVT